MVDGGKGQLGRAVAVLERFGLHGQVPVASLAKQQEELFLPGRSQIRCCCRAIRRGCTWCSASATRRTALPSPPTASGAIKPGLPRAWMPSPALVPTRRKALLTNFGGLQEIRQASTEELLTIPGITIKLADAIRATLAIA